MKIFMNFWNVHADRNPDYFEQNARIHSTAGHVDNSPGNPGCDLHGKIPRLNSPLERCASLLKNYIGLRNARIPGTRR
jgi:hypothetical protein